MRAWAVVDYEAPLQEIELPTPEPQGTEVLVETTYCGVCAACCSEGLFFPFLAALAAASASARVCLGGCAGLAGGG